MDGLARTIVLLGVLPFGEPQEPQQQQKQQEQRKGANAERIQVLFLGDRGHHEPESRADAVIPGLARLGVDVYFTTDLGLLDPEWLRHVDVLLIYANIDEIEPEREKSLLEFVERGGGLVAVHCASYCFRNSEAYVALVGGQFDRHGVGEFKARTIEPGHPSLLGVSEFTTTDETYVHRALADDRKVLQVRDEGGRAEPYTWVRESGEGRVYYTALGHDLATWGQPAFLTQLAQAIRWAAGRPDFTFAAPKLETFDAKVPNYTPGARWGTESAPFTKLQKPLSPEDERKTMQVPPGFDVRLFASEPDVVKPIALSFDERGRLWVLESVDYPNDKLPGGKGHDRVKILEDTDGDGRVDAVKVFADGLNIPTGLVCTSDGCIVAQAPDMLRYFDRDGDDRADERRVLFTGFGEGDTHAGPSNLRWEVSDNFNTDAQIWGTVGYSAFHGKVGPPDSAVEHRFGQAVFRFAPDGSRLERIASTTNNTWGLGFDERGEIFVSTANGDHLVHVAVPSPAIESVFGLVADGTVHVPDHDRLHPIVELRQVDYHGGFTAAAGCAIYTDRAFPRRYWNRCAFVCEPTGHLVHQCFLDPSGSTYVARDGRNLLASWDEWCAPIAAEVGPDGAVWVLDWYSPIVQHNPTPRGFETGKGNAYETPHRDKEHGRIWRVVWSDATTQPTPDVASADKARLDELRLRHPSQLVRRFAERRLSEVTDRLMDEPQWRCALPDEPARRNRWFDLVALEIDWIPLAMDEHELRRLAAAGEMTSEDRAAYESDLEAIFDLEHRIPAALDSNDRGRALAAKIVVAHAWTRSIQRLLDRTNDPHPATKDGTANELTPVLDSTFDERDDPRAPNWDFVRYGGGAFGSWSQAGHRGPGSTQIRSESGADASFSRSVAVKPHSRYRLSGWIKTEGIVPLGDAYGALFNVHELQNPRVVTRAITGTRDWTKVEVEFDSGDHEQLTVNCLLGGWGRAQGTAWYDDVSLEFVSRGSPEAELVETVVTHAAHDIPARAFEIVTSHLEKAEPDMARSALEGLLRGLPRELREKQVTVAPEIAEILQRTMPRLDVGGRAALLLVAERCGRLDLFPDEVAGVRVELATMLANGNAQDEDRTDAAARLLALAPPGEAVPLVANELTALASPELVRGLLLALGECGAAEVGPEVAKRAGKLSTTTLPSAIELLLRRPEWTKELIAQLLPVAKPASGKLDPKLLPPDVFERMKASSDPEIARVGGEIAASLGRPRDPDRAKVVDRFLHLANPPADAPPADARRGAEVFAQQCAKCHVMKVGGQNVGQGHVGPDLTDIGKRGKADLLVEILDPNRSIEGTYRAWLVTLKNGDDFTGRLVNEGRTTFELVDAAATRHVLARDDVATMRPLTKSLMPEGHEDIGERDLAALLEYLTTSVSER